jgi:hypothetical protein
MSVCSPSLPAHILGFTLALALASGAGCRDEGGGTSPGTGGTSARPGTGGAGPSDAHAEAAEVAAGADADGPRLSDASACKLEELAPPDDGADHAPVCGTLQHRTNPPSSGTHYPTWAFFRAYDKPVPWGFLLHALEHGAVVIAYNCPTGCAAELAEAKALMESVPRKSACPKPRPPVIVVPDPKLEVRFAAAAWGHILRAECFDRPAFARFIDAHLNMGPEFFPTDCGAVDLESAGWCP